MNRISLKLKENESQSLFYWNPFCNFFSFFLLDHVNCRNPYFIGILSAIPTLSTYVCGISRRNPYFIGILSAIRYLINKGEDFIGSQSLFYWNPFCNIGSYDDLEFEEFCRNPYFIGILSAI